MKIAITGASGFIGTEVLKHLSKQQNIEIVALSRTLASEQTKLEPQEEEQQSAKDASEGVSSIIKGNQQTSGNASEGVSSILKGEQQSSSRESEGVSSILIEKSQQPSRNQAECSSLTRGQTESSRIVWSQTDYSVDSLVEIFKDIDAVIHLAAVRGTTGTIADYQSNEVITENILLAMGKANVKRFVFTSSIAVYSDTAEIPWTERTPLFPKTLYGVTKVTCENLCLYYSRKFGFSYTILRVAQVVGSGETHRGIMNVFMDTAAAGGQLKVIGKSIAKRQYIYLNDLVELLVRAAMDEGKECGIYNVGMKEAYSNLELAKIVNAIYDNKTPIDYQDSTPETCEASLMDVSKMEEYFGYVPALMRETVEKVRKQ